MTTATLTDAATVTLVFPLAAVEGLRHAITLAIHERPTSERDMLASIYGALVNPQPAPTVRAAGAPVDVLAVMDAAHATFDNLRHERRHNDDALRQSMHWTARIEEIIKARAAIAELIRETTLMLEANPVTAAEREYYEARVRAALARVGGGK